VTGDSWKNGAKEVDSRKLKVERKPLKEALRPVRTLRPVRWWEVRDLNVGGVEERSFDSLPLDCARGRQDGCAHRTVSLTGRESRIHDP